MYIIMKSANKDIYINLISKIRNLKLMHCIVPSIFIVIISVLLIKIPFSDILVLKKVDNIDSLSENNDKSDIEYFSISSENWLYSGYDHYHNDDISGYIYYTITSSNMCYFMIVSPEYVNTDTMSIIPSELQVTIDKRTPYMDSFLGLFANDLNWTFESLEKVSSGIILTTVTYNTTIYQILLGLLTLLLAYSIINIVYNAIVIIFPVCCIQFRKKHCHSPETIRNRKEFLMLLQSELDSYIYKTENMYITENYLVNLTSYDICVVPINKICLVLQHGTLRKFLWIYLKITHTMHFLCNNKLKCTFSHKSIDSVNTIIEKLKEINPDLLLGYTPENKEKYLQIIKSVAGR